MGDWAYALYFALLAAIVVVLKMMFGRKQDAPSDGARPKPEACATCSSATGGCLHDCIMAKAAAEAEYFDDEELDRFRGRRADSYTPEEAGMFAEVMYTMRPEEVKDWLRSLSLRQVELPDSLKDEAAMLAEG